jgi:hypothetical protein
MNWKIFAIIAATAIATAAAVVFILQKQNSKRKMRFDSCEFDDDDFLDDIACGEQCNYADDSVEFGETVEKVADAAEETVDKAADKVTDLVEKAADAVEDAIDDIKDAADAD